MFSYYYIHNLPDYTNYMIAMIKESSDQCFAMAGLTRTDVDVAFVGDPTTICVTVNLAGAGFCEVPAAGRYVASGVLSPGGSLPTNTHGGCLSCAHPGTPGQLLHIVEAVRQLRGEADGRQVERAPTWRLSMGRPACLRLRLFGASLEGVRPWTSTRGSRTCRRRSSRDVAEESSSSRSAGAAGAFSSTPRCCVRTATISDSIGIGRQAGATLYSYTVVHRPLSSALRGRVPYVVGIVDLAEGVRMMTNIVDCPTDVVAIGMPLEVRFDTSWDGRPIPVFRPAAGLGQAVDRG